MSVTVMDEAQSQLSATGGGRAEVLKPKEPRMFCRWPINPISPIVGSVEQPFEFRTGTFRAIDVSLAGIAVEATGLSFSPMADEVLSCRLSFAALGELWTELRIRWVREGPSGVLFIHAEFCELTARHIELISRYLARYCSSATLSKAKEEGLVPGELAEFVEFSESVPAEGAGSSVITAAVMQDLVLRVTVDPIAEGVCARFSWSSETLSSWEFVSQVIFYLAPRVVRLGGRLLVADSGFDDVLTALGFGNRADGGSSAFEIDLPSAIAGYKVPAGKWLMYWRHVGTSVANQGVAVIEPPAHKRILLPLTRWLSSRAQGAGTAEVSWIQYALHYDNMCSVNPAYEENVQIIRDRLKDFAVEDGSVIYDFGAGTGNVVRAVAQLLPGSQIYHVDNNAAMNLVARQKYAADGLDNVVVCTHDIEKFEPPARSADVVLCVHAAYTLQRPERLLGKAFGCLREGGLFFIVDIGRPIRLGQWTAYCFYHAVRRMGLVKTTRLFVAGTQVIRQNRNIYAHQQTGTYWRHDLDVMIDALCSAGFEVLEAGTCYRGISDFAVCRKPGQDG